MDTPKRNLIAKDFELISIPNDTNDPGGPATLFKVPKDIIMAYIKMTKPLREQFEEISKIMMARAMEVDAKGFLEMAASEGNDIPNFVLEILSQSDIKTAMDNLSTQAVIEYRDFWGHKDFLDDYGVTDAKEIRTITEGLEWHTWQPEKGWSNSTDTANAVDIEDDGTVRIKLDNLTKPE